MPFSRGYPQTHMDMALADVSQNFLPRSAESETRLCEMRLDHLRKAIRGNQVTFPSQVPMFTKHDRPDLQQKLTQLYFVLGWSAAKIGARFGISRLRVQQILNTWKRRAVEVGYIQSVPPPESLRLLSEHPPIRLFFSQGGSVSGSAQPRNQVLAEFKKPGADRTAYGMAEEADASPCAIRQDIQLHRELKLGTNNAASMEIITRSDGPHHKK